MLDKKIRLLKTFLFSDQLVHDEPLVYLDNAATTQKPKRVLKQLITIIAR